MKSAIIDTFNHQKTKFMNYIDYVSYKKNVGKPHKWGCIHCLKKNFGKEDFFLQDDCINKACAFAKRSPWFVDESGFSSENLGNFTFFNNSSGSFGYVLRSQ